MVYADCNFAFLSATNIAGQNPPTFAPYQSLFQDLEHDASVYLCSVAAREPVPVPSDPATQLGKITLWVQRVLHGQSRQSIALSYISIFGGVKGVSVWPRLDDIGNKTLLCVITPDTVNRGALKFSDIRQAASRVSVVAGPQDPEVQEMIAICNLYSTRGTPACLHALQNALLRPHGSQSYRFALEMVAAALGKTDQEAAIALLKAEVPKFLSAEDPAAVRLVQFFYFAVPDNREPWNGARVFFRRCLAVLATAPANRLSEEYVQDLAHDLTQESTYASTLLLSGLSTAEKTALQESLEKDQRAPRTTITPEQSQQVRDWLAR